MKSKLFRPNQLADIPNSLGIYAWFIAYDYRTTPHEYHDIFRSAKLDCTVEGVFKDSYKGALKQQSLSFDDEIPFSRFLNSAVKSFCPPLYIGMSSDLQRRLTTHKDKLNKILHSQPDIEYYTHAEVDSDEESTNFAIRISNIIRETHSIKISNLRVRVVEATNDMNRKDVLTVERFLNLTYTPIYGRR